MLSPNWRDWKGDAGRQQIRRWINGEWRDRKQAATAATATHEVRAQEPILPVACAQASPQEVIVESARAQFASGKGERARRGRRPIDRFHHLNAIAGRFRTHTTDIGDVHDCVAGSRAAADDQ
jgi:hypothetical protein